MRYVHIPMDRIAVLIGHNGETKEHLEEKSKIPITIDSETGEVTIDDHETEDPFIIFKVENVVRAIGRGFSPQQAFRLFSDDYDLFIFDIHDYVKKKSSHVRRMKARVIGSNGKTKRILEELTGSQISIYGHTVAIIGNVVDIDIAKKAINKLLQGSKISTVYHFVEQSMKELHLHHGF